jgi:hypothetical protein
MKWSVVLALVAGCSTAAPNPPPAPQLVVVERVVYVERAPAPEAVERVEPGPPLEPSPLIAVAEEPTTTSISAREQKPDRSPDPVGWGSRAELDAVSEEPREPRRLSMLERQRLERELARCERRGSKWARARCEERARAR